MMDPKTSGLVIYAKDYKKLADFYAKVLQLNITERDDEFVLMESQGFELVILQAPPSIAEKITLSDPPTPRENTAIKSVFFVESIQAARGLAKDHSGFVNPSEKEWKFRGYTLCDGYDSEGNVFQLRAE